MALALVAAVAEAVAILHYWGKPPVRAGAPFPVSVPAPVRPMPSAHPTQYVSLDVERNGQSLRLKWNRNATAVRDAAYAILHITDGPHRSQLNLDSSLLHSGLLSYWPETHNVQFRMELFAPGQTVTESVRSLNGVRAEPVADAVAPQPRRPATPQGFASRSAAEARPSPFAAPKTPRPSPESGAAAPKTTPAAPIPKSPEKEEPSAPPPTPPRHPTEIREIVVPLPAQPPATYDKAEVTEVTDPAHGSRLGRMVGKIPLLRRLRKHPETAPDQIH